MRRKSRLLREVLFHNGDRLLHVYRVYETLVLKSARLGEVDPETRFGGNGTAVKKTIAIRGYVRNGMEWLVIIRPDDDRTDLDCRIGVLIIHDAEPDDFRPGWESRHRDWGNWSRECGCFGWSWGATQHSVTSIVYGPLVRRKHLHDHVG